MTLNYLRICFGAQIGVVSHLLTHGHLGTTGSIQALQKWIGQLVIFALTEEFDRLLKGSCETLA